MLILTRRPDEALHIGDNIVITVSGIRGNQVRLGIQAPKHVVIDREEVHARKLREHTPSAAVIPAPSSIGSAASEPRAVHSPSSVDPVEKTAAGFSTDAVRANPPVLPDAARALAKRIVSDPHLAAEFLKQAGIIDRPAVLATPYRSAARGCVDRAPCD